MGFVSNSQSKGFYWLRHNFNMFDAAGDFFIVSHGVALPFQLFFKIIHNDFHYIIYYKLKAMLEK